MLAVLPRAHRYETITKRTTLIPVEMITRSRFEALNFMEMMILTS
jgi:hypothetical protein